jgi:hypothetical protein
VTFAGVTHIALHFAVPLLVALCFYRQHWLRVYCMFMATMAVDVDHLFATPIYDPNRCSIGFHPLHTAPAVAVYVALAVFKRTRLIGIGLLIHMALDFADC